MTEETWLTGTEPESMLEYLQGRVSERKLLLFGCACWRRIWHLLPEGPSRQAVEVAERYADGLATSAELDEARLAAMGAALETRFNRILRGGRVIEAMERVADGLTREAILSIQAARLAAEWIGDWAVAAESKAQCDLLRDVFGNPFRPVAVEPAWRYWNDGTAVKLAEVIYQERRFEDLPILADALEEAGCTDPVLLAHCREPGAHVRGCWVIDSLLDRTDRVGAAHSSDE